MRIRIPAFVLLTTCLLAGPIFAQPEESRDARGPARQRVLRAFDRDSDGRLNEEERASAREQLGERFDEVRRQTGDLFEDRRGGDARDGESRRRDEDRDRASRRGGDGDRRRGTGPVARGPARGGDDRDRPRDRGPRDRARPDRPRGPIGPMPRGPERSLQALFGWFDSDGDNMLNRREFAELAQFVERHHPGPPRGPGARRPGWRGPGAFEPQRGAYLQLERRRSFDGSRRSEDRDRRESGPRGGGDERREARGRDGRERGERRAPDEREPQRPGREGSRASEVGERPTAANLFRAI